MLNLRKTMNNLAVIPARSGSKGIKDKNVKDLNGKPLMAYTIEAALESNQFETVMVSTDSEEYAGIAKSYGAEVPFLRSKDTSSDQASSWEAVTEVLNQYKELGKEYDTICLLQPTSPLRRVDDIVNAYKLLEQRNGDAVTSVCQVDYSPSWTMALSPDGSLKEFRKNKAIYVPRQQLGTFYRLNGAVYIRKIEYINNSIRLLDNEEFAYIMPRRNSIDIDSMEDFEYAEYILKNISI